MTFIERVLTRLTARGFSGRAEPVAGSNLVHFYARAPYGYEGSETYELAGDDWAITLTGSPHNVSDVVCHLIGRCKSRTGER